MPRLSIVIPCLGDASEFEGTLVSVLQHRPADCEVLVVHRRPYDDPYDLNGEVRFLHCEAASLIGLINAATKEAAGEVLHTVACGLEATDQWTRGAVARFDDPEVAAVSPVIVGRHEPLISAGVTWSLGGARCEIKNQRCLLPGSGRLRAKVTAPTLAAGFYRRDVLVALGGFEETLGDELADVALGLCLPALGLLHVVETSSQLVQVQQPALAPHRDFARGRAHERLFLRYVRQRGLFRSLLMHAVQHAAAAISSSPSSGRLWSLVGRVAAWLDLTAARQHSRRLAQAELELSQLAPHREVLPMRRSAEAATVVERRKAA